MKKLLLLWLGLISLMGSAQNLHIRPIGGTPPYTYVVRDQNGNQTANRSSSAAEETFPYPGGGYSYSVTDASGKSLSKSVDAASAEVIRTPAKVYSKAFGKPSEQVEAISTMPVGFNQPGLTFSFYDWYQESLPMTQAQKDGYQNADIANIEAGNFINQNWWGFEELKDPWQGIDNPLWDQEFDHVNNTASGQRHPYDDVVRAAYVWKNAQAGRLGIKLGISFGRKQNTLSDFHPRFANTYSLSDCQGRPDGKAHVAKIVNSPNELMCGSFASDKVKAYYQKALLKFCKRYRRAINDGTIANLNLIFDNSGESQPELTYMLEDGSKTRNLGDFSISMRTKFAAHLASKFGNNVTAFNQKFSTSVSSFDVSQFSGDYLLNGPTLLQMHFNWFQMECMSLFERDLKDYVYTNANLTRSHLWALDVGGILDGLIYVRKSLNFNRRISQQTRWIQAKSNNDVNFTDYAVDQIISAKRYMGEAAGMWEPSPSQAEITFTPEIIGPAVNAAKAQGISISAFIPSNAYERWTAISNATNLAGYTVRPKDNDFVNLTIKFKDIVMEGKYEGWAGEGKIREAYDALRSQNPGKRVNIFVDDSDILSDYPGSTVNPPQPATGVPSRLAVMTNSYGKHKYAANIGWYWGDRGMAASAPEKDFLHLLRAKVKAVNPSAQVELTPDRISGALFEGFYHDQTQFKFENVTADLIEMGADGLLIAIGENVTDSDVYTKDMKTGFVRLIQAVRAANPTIKIGLTTASWDRQNYDAVATQIASEQTTAQSPITLISRKFLSDIFRAGTYTTSPYFAWNQQFDFPAGTTVFPTDGVKNHPSDLGMQWHADKYWNDWIVPVFGGNSSGGGSGGGEEESGEITEVNPLTDVSLNAVPTYSLPSGGYNVLTASMPFATQANYAQRGMVNLLHVEKLWSEIGGIYDAQANPQGKTVSQLKTVLDAYNLPSGVGMYRMMYDNVVAPFWPVGQAAPNSQQQLNETVEGYAVAFRNELGWQNRPMILDIDFEDGRFFSYAGVKAQADAVRYTLLRHPEIKIQVYASSHNNASVDAGGSPSNPNDQIGPGLRFQMFKDAGVNVYSGTVPYFHFPSYSWNDPSHEPSIIGTGKLYPNQADYALKSLNPIQQKLAWTDQYFASIPYGHKPENLEWYMNIYEGGDDGGPRQYDAQGNWISSMNWPVVGNWILEGLPMWGLVTGSYRWGGGLYNWMDNRPRKVGQDHFEAGKWRMYQYNRFYTPATIWNIKLEYSLDGGSTWQNDDRTDANILATNQNPKPYVRGAYRAGELLVVATAGQPFHLNGSSQNVKIRYNGKTVDKTFQSQKVHTFTVKY